MNLSLSLRTGSGTVLLLKPPHPRGTLVVAHGAGNDRFYSFAPFFDAALREGFQVLSLDLPGHGQGNSSIFEVERAVEDFSEAVTLARHAAPNADLPWILVGNSLGGALSMRAVAETPLRPAGVIGIGMPTRLQLGWRSIWGELPSLLSPAMLSYREHVTSWKEVFPAFGAFRREDFPVRCDRNAYLDAIAAVLNRSWEITPPEIPVLLVQGSRDAVARAAETRLWVERMRQLGADVTLSVLPRVGHLDVMLSRRVHAAVLGWARGRMPAFP